MNPDLEVDADELHHTASALAGTADRVTAGTRDERHRRPDPALGDHRRGDHGRRAAAGSRLACSAPTSPRPPAAFDEAAEAYEDADARAAHPAAARAR